MATDPQMHDSEDEEPARDDGARDADASPPPADDHSEAQADSKSAADFSSETKSWLARAVDSSRIRQHAAGGAEPPLVGPSGEAIRFGRYRVDRKLGEGGFGEVFLGHDEALNRAVAIKVPKGRWTPERIMEFEAEARRLAQLQHPGIVAVHDIGKHGEAHYIVTEYVQGQSLDTLIRELPMPWQTAVELIAQVADALAHAHAHSMIHRDIKPGNIMINREGRPVLLDFGLGMTDLDTPQRGDETAGTPSYMAPEQVWGRSVRVDGRTDIYSLGAVLYQLLCQRVPFRARSLDVLFRKIRHDDPQPPRQINSQLPAAVEQVCLKALAKRMADRYTTAADFGNALRRALLSVTSPLSNVSDATTQNLGIVPASAESAALTGLTATPGFGQPQSTSARRRREAEHRQLTLVMFNFEVTPRSPDAPRNADQDLALVEAFQAWCRDCVLTFGGRVVPTADQRVLGCFGFPVAYEDSARRAVHAALRMRDQTGGWVERCVRSTGHTASTWALVHSGDVVASETGDGPDFRLSLVGDATSVISRLETNIPAGHVVVTGATRHLIGGFFRLESAGEQAVRGLAAPVELHRVAGAMDRPNRVELSDPATLTPLVGRTTEVNILKERWEHAIEGFGQVVLLIGEAGLGKSRLIHEIRNVTQESPAASGDSARLRDSGGEGVSDGRGGAGGGVERDRPEVRPRAIVIEWRASAYHQNTGLYPVIEYLERTLGYARDDSSADKLGKLIEALRRSHLASSENIALMAELLAVNKDPRCPPLDHPPQVIRERTVDLLLRWIRTRSEQAPVLFIVEDLHWADPTTLELLQRHVHDMRSGRMLSLFTFRPDFPLPWRSFQHQTQIALNRLSRRQVRDMLVGRLGRTDIPDFLVARIADRTDGIPLFIEEFAALVQESGVLDHAGSESLVIDAIPATLQDLLTARLDRLQCEPEVVQMAATIGREFSWDVLEAASSLPPQDIRRELDKLVHAEIVYQRSASPSSTYVFKHALIQESAYRSQLLRRRQQFHGRIAQALEDNFPDIIATQPELLAHHHTEAGSTERAIEFWRRAGQRSVAQSAQAEAASHFRRGLELIATQPTGPARDTSELSFLVPLGVALLAARGYAHDDVGPIFQRAGEVCERVGDTETLFYVVWGTWAWRLVRSDLVICTELCQRLLAIAAAQSDSSWTCEAHFAPTVVSYYQGRFVESVEHAERAIRLLEPARCSAHAAGTGQDVRVGVLSFAAMSLWSLGRVDEAIARAREAVAVGRTLKHSMSLSFALHHSAWALLDAQLWDEAESMADEALQLATDQGLALWIGSARFHRAMARWFRGERRGTLEDMESGCAAFIATGARCAVPMYFTTLARAYLDAGDLDRARERLDRAFRWAEQHDSQNHHLAETHRVQGDWLRASRPHEPALAEQQFLCALQIAAQQHARSWELRASLSLARLWESQGRTSEARERVTSVLRQFTQGAHTPDLIDARTWLDS